jgi:hypothetical protein
VTYLILGTESPVEIVDPPQSYLIDRGGYIVVDQRGMADWNTSRVRELLDQLLAAD